MTKPKGCDNRTIVRHLAHGEVARIDITNKAGQSVGAGHSFAGPGILTITWEEIP